MLIQSGQRPVSIRASGMHIDARNALFAVMTHPEQGQRVSVLKGQVKIKYADKKVTFVPEGKSLQMETENPPLLSALDAHPDSISHRDKLALLASEPQDRSEEATPASGAVGKGAHISFDLKQRRAASLLTAPNLQNIERPDVSPEQPAPE